MPRRKAPDTMEELNDAREIEGRKKRRGRGCLFSLAASIIVLLVALYGFILVRQRLLDLEMEAYLRAVQTATAGASQPIIASPEEEMPKNGQSMDAAMDEVDTAHTATFVVQLTDAAEFLQTLTPQP